MDRIRHFAYMVTIIISILNTANSIGDNLAIYAAVLAILFNNQSYSKLL